MTNNVDAIHNHEIVEDQAPEARPPMTTNPSTATTDTMLKDDASLSKVGSKSTSTDFGSTHPQIGRAHV